MPAPCLARLPLAFVASILVGLSVPCEAKNFLNAEPLKREDVEQTLAEELAGHAHPKRLLEIQRQLQVVYGALPKNEFGLLNHQAVRYVLHRFFVQQHGWYIRGLEPNGVAQIPKRAAGPLKDWVAAYLQDGFEKRAHNVGISLMDLAALATTLEDLIRKEASRELEDIYRIMDFPVDGRISFDQAKEAIRAYMMIYLTNRNVSLSSRGEAERKLKIFQRKYKNYTEADAFMRSMEQRHSELASGEGVSFNTSADIVADMGEHFASFNDGECKDLKRSLQGMSGNAKLGRVKLYELYNRSLHTHWKFTEKAEFLKQLGAIDESGSQPSIIIPNYLSAFTNCLKATSLYAVCCRNECEDLIGHLERQIAAPRAFPEVIADLVAALPSDTVAAPRKLPESLLRRLALIAVANGGEVHIHGRLFAQWMHHAFPLECPYPHEAGTTSPQTAAEWMERTGLAAHASEGEMRQAIEDACSTGEGSGEALNEDGEAEMLWSDAEELLVAPPASFASLRAMKRAACVVLALSFLVIWFVTGQLRMVRGWSQRLRKALLFASLVAALCAVDLIDMTLFLFLAFGVVLFLTLPLPKARRELAAGKLEKCCV